MQFDLNHFQMLVAEEVKLLAKIKQLKDLIKETEKVLLALEEELDLLEQQNKPQLLTPAQQYLDDLYKSQVSQHH